MNAAKLKAALHACANEAAKAEPVHIELRSRCFVAQLVGTLADQDEELAKSIWTMVLGHDWPGA